MTEMQAAAETQDKAQIGLTPVADQQLDELLKTGWFADRQDCYRLAIAVALARHLEPSAAEMVGIRTTYNFTGGVDRDGKLRQLIAALNPAEVASPATFSERLAHAGLAFLFNRLVTANGTLSDALDPDQTAPWA
ncbi:hypothetical protein [Comamonas sp. BIGb0124]|uniref:hypothetical protein n=1 Tax=Comamonas sp. BIGb0124 TaxID=2485130 RepID=UPI000F471B45|nr:hypothetical protein [Comamonas sp. BIGb0124]